MFDLSLLKFGFSGNIAIFLNALARGTLYSDYVILSSGSINGTLVHLKRVFI